VQGYTTAVKTLPTCMFIVTFVAFQSLAKTKYANERSLVSETTSIEHTNKKVSVRDVFEQISEDKLAEIDNKINELESKITSDKKAYNGFLINIKGLEQAAEEKSKQANAKYGQASKLMVGGCPPMNSCMIGPHCESRKCVLLAQESEILGQEARELRSSVESEVKKLGGISTQLEASLNGKDQLVERRSSSAYSSSAAEAELDRILTKPDYILAELLIPERINYEDGLTTVLKLTPIAIDNVNNDFRSSNNELLKEVTFTRSMEAEIKTSHFSHDSTARYKVSG
jgi:hypothetical protein